MESRIKDLASVAPLGVLTLGITLGTGSFATRARFGNLRNRHTDSRRDKGVRIFQPRPVFGTKLFAEFQAGGRPNSFGSETLQECLDGFVREKSQNVPRQNVLGKGRQQQRSRCRKARRGRFRQAGLGGWSRGSGSSRGRRERPLGFPNGAVQEGRRHEG